MENSKVIDEFMKSANEKVRVELGEYKGKGMINVRVYYLAEDGKEWKPSPKGITMSSELTQELKGAIDKAYVEWEKRLPSSN